MDFWNEYEGKTIEGTYTLERLLYPEGRNGFFSTRNGTGTPAVVRLTESLNDQAEMFAKWRTIRDLEHPNLLAIRSYGQTVLDESPLLYAVLEPADMNLGEILRERAMTPEETREIAESAIAALRALHENGLVHGHIEASAVFAVGEAVKLRSDCVRKAPEGAEGEALKALDAQALALLLLEALTRQRSQRETPLPAPFHKIVEMGASGLWGIEEMAAALEAPVDPALDELAASDLQNEMEQGNEMEEAESPVVFRVEEIEAVQGPPAAAERPSEARESLLPRGMGPWIGVALVLLASILAWYLLNPMTPEQREIAASKPAAASAAAESSPLALPFAAPTSATASPSSSAPVAPTSAPPTPAPLPPASAPLPGVASKSGSKEAWRVVVYSFNEERLARAEAAALMRRHNSMRPQVFSPTGQAPFLVTLGGPMDHERALGLQRKARSQGLPRDTYVRNFASQ